MRRLAVAVAVGLALLAAGGERRLALADPSGEATAAVRAANEAIRALLREEPPRGSRAESALGARVLASVKSFLDIDELGRRALGEHWHGLDHRHRAEYLRLLRRLIEQSYVRGVRAQLDYQVAYLGEEASGEGRVVRTEIRTQRRGKPYTLPIDYELREVDGGWRAFDVVTDGVGLVANYRAQFSKIIGREGIDGLLARMRKKAEAGGG
jgi:phospholipid transport system substrate-binding protein